MKFYKNKLLTTVTAVALALAVGACSSSSDDDNGISAAQMAVEAELAALQAAFGEDDLTPDAITALTTQVETLMARAEITPEAVQALNDQITALLAAMPEDVQALNDQIMALTTQVATLMAREDITPEAVQALREQITALMATTPADIPALNDEIMALNTQIATLMAGEGITPVEVQALNDQIASLTDQVTALMARADISPTEVQALRDQVTALMASAPQDIQALNDQITTLTDLLATANLMVTALEAQIGSMDDEADASETASLHAQLKAAKVEVARIQLAAADALKEAAMKERIAREKGIRAAIVLLDNRVGEVAKGFPTGISEVIATRKAGKVMIDVNGDTDDVYTGGEVSADNDAWTSAMLTKTDEASEATDTLVIYTDIEAPSDKLFTLQYSQIVRDNIFGELARLKMARASGFPSGPSVTWTYDGSPSGRAKTFPGTFDGVAGQFACTDTADCSLGTNPKGELATATGTSWRFTPQSPLTATVKDPDVAYAYFGWWLNKPKANDGIHDVEVFAGGTQEHAVTIAAAIVGNASYAGPAAGKYVTKSFTAGVHTDSGVGHFTATASLAAKFGVDSGVLGTVGGTIGSFILDGATTVPWSVKLEDADLDMGSTPFKGTTEVNFGGGFTATEVGGAGTWQGSFYDAGATPADAPGAVAGTFDAVTDNASLIGGFGATKK